MNRRQLLQGAGLAAGTLYLPSLLGDRAAYAQSPPKRLLVMRGNHGPVTGRWELRPQGLPGDWQSEWELPLGPLAESDFTKTLQPLYPYRNDILILEGLALTSAIAADLGNQHFVQPPHLLTGAPSGTLHVSFDQYVADAIAVPGRFKYLGYGQQNSGMGWYDTAGNPITPGPADNGSQLATAVSRVFGALGGTQPTSSGPPTGIALSLARRQASTDQLRAEYQRLAARLSAEDRAKLLLHRDMLADLGKRVSELAKITCDKPTDLSNVKAPSSSKEIATIVMSRLLPTAMACDLTRVGFFSHWELTASDIGAPMGTEVHGGAAHASQTNPVAAGWMENYYRIHTAQIAQTIAAFKSVAEGSGTMLDNSIILLSCELGSGWHDEFRRMYVIAGGRNLGLKLGRYIKYAETGPNPWNLFGKSPYGTRLGYPPANQGTDRWGLGPAHNLLLVSLMQAFGLDRTSIGLDAAVGTGYLPGQKIQMTGPLPRLRG